MQMKAIELSKYYRNASSRRQSTAAVVSATLTLQTGETVGLIGESGCGKSTLGLMLSGLMKPSGGQIILDDQPLHMPYRGDTRRRIQMLFQHPETVFNPMLPIINSLKEAYRRYAPPYTPQKLYTDLARVGLTEKHVVRHPHTLSGGELQRLAILRLLILKPDFIVLDEPTSMLDVVTQAQIMRLLQCEQRQNGTGYLLITHDPALAQACCDRIYKMNGGCITLERKP